MTNFYSLILMSGPRVTKTIDESFFKHWTPTMSYVLGYIVADGCILVRRNRIKNRLSLNITSVDGQHLRNIRRALHSNYAMSKKPSSTPGHFGFQLQIPRSNIAADLIRLGVYPRKTYHLDPIAVPKKYFRDFVRGFFDGDGTVFMMKINGVPQIKAKFLSTSRSFLTDLANRLSSSLQIPQKTIHARRPTERRMAQYHIDFYIDDCRKLSQFMYGHRPTIYLPRKRKIFDQWQHIKRRHYIKQNYPSKTGWHLSEGRQHAPTHYAHE